MKRTVTVPRADGRQRREPSSPMPIKGAERADQNFVEKVAPKVAGLSV